MDLRKYAYKQNPHKVRKSVTNYSCGAIRPKCEALEEELRNRPTQVKLDPKLKTEAEFQQEQEETRAFIRNKNCKLFDKKLEKLKYTSDNGSGHLQTEIKSSG